MSESPYILIVYTWWEKETAAADDYYMNMITLSLIEFSISLGLSVYSSRKFEFQSSFILDFYFLIVKWFNFCLVICIIILSIIDYYLLIFFK